MNENERSLAKIPQQRELVVRVEQSGMELVRGNSFLQRVGFSTQLPERLLRLNDVLIRKDPPQLRGVTIDMTPGKIPLITTEVRHSNGICMSLRAAQSGTASLRLESDSDIGVVLTIGDIQGFVKSLFPDNEAKISAKASPDLAEPMDDIHEDLHNIDTDKLKLLYEFKRQKRTGGAVDTSSVYPYPNFKVSVSGKRPFKADGRPPFELNILFSLRGVHFSDVIGCSIKEFEYQDDTRRVEEILEQVASLFDKPVNYPFAETPKITGEIDFERE